VAKKIYAVRKGRQTGIFETWEECRQVIEGFSGAEYKSFSRLEDAQAYMNNEDIAQIQAEKLQEASVLSNTVIAYIDGSYNKEIQKYAFGCVFITPKKEIIKESGCGNHPEAILINNVAGELLGSMFAARWAIKNGYKNIEIRHDYEGVAKWVSGEWKVKNEIVKLYVDKMKKYQELIHIQFTKVNAHTNDPFNDEADKLAKSVLASGKKAKNR